MDLLFTDVVLPNGMEGRRLADAARRVRPDLEELFTTGYSRNAIVHNGRLDPGVHLVSKPFTFEALAAKLRAVRRPTFRGGSTPCVSLANGEALSNQSGRALKPTMLIALSGLGARQDATAGLLLS